MATATLASEESELDAVFAALSNPTRRGLLTRLGSSDATISELAEPYDMTLAAVSKHLGVLESAGLIRRTRHGKSQRCALLPSALDSAETWIQTRKAFWTANLDSLADYFDGEDA